MSHRRQASPGRYVVALVIAIAGHALTMWLAILFGAFAAIDPHPPSALATPVRAADDPGTQEYDRPLEIQALVDELKEPERPSEAEKVAEAEKKKQEEDPKAKGQVVDIPRPAIEERPDDSAKFLAEYDSRVNRETRGKVGHDRAGGGDAAATVERPRVPRMVAHSSRAVGAAAKTGRSASGEGGALGQAGESTEVSEEGDQRRPGMPGMPGAPGAPSTPQVGENGKPGDRGADRPNLQPSEEELTRAIAHGTGSPDYLRDIDDGESTALNAKKFKFASFFNRVKRAVGDEWHPDTVYLRHDPTGHVYGGKDRVTVLRVHLEPSGNLKNVTMLNPSGVGFLDDEAMDAFRRAQPFVNPPAQLIDADGLIHFNFAFIFELSGSTSFKVYKYQ